MRKLIFISLIIGLSVLGKLLLHKIIKNKKIASVLSVLWCVLIFFLMAVYPVENIFVTFDSSEDAARYASRGTLVDVIHGENSCLAFSSVREGENQATYVRKTEKGYKLCGVLSVKNISQIKNDKIILNVYNVRNTSDYYISLDIMFIGNKEVKIYNHSGEQIECEIKVIEAVPFSWVYINDFSDDYYIVLNGERMEFE